MGDSFLNFADRTDAGRQLAERLAALEPENPVIYALPRGGVPVAVVIAERLRAPLDLVLVRKLGAPQNPEVALGAIVEGDTPETVLNDDVRRASGADDAYIARIRTRELDELKRRKRMYLGDRPRQDPSGRTVIVVDDGLATGATMKAALIALKRQGAARIIVALPVAQHSALKDIATQAGTVICLHPAQHFHGVGEFYLDFHQMTDEETIGLLRQYWARSDV